MQINAVMLFTERFVGFTVNSSLWLEVYFERIILKI